MTNIFDFSLIRHITLDGLANALWRGLISLSFLSLRLISLSSWLRLSRFSILDWKRSWGSKSRMLPAFNRKSKIENLK